MKASPAPRLGGDPEEACHELRLLYHVPSAHPFQWPKQDSLAWDGEYNMCLMLPELMRQ